MNDYNTFSLVAMIQQGSKRSEFGALENSYFFKWVVPF